MRVGVCLGVLLCVVVLSQPVFAYPEYAENGMGGASPGTGSAEISVPQHLIEVDFSNPVIIAVRETIIFLNVAGDNYTRDLMTWVPDSANVMGVTRKEMSESMPPVSLEYTHDNNILRFNDAERFNAAGMPPMYAVQYVIPVAAEAEIVDYTKKLAYPTYINYPISSLVVRIIPAEGMDPFITDEGGNKIQGDSIESELDMVVHTWSAPQFKEFTIGINPHTDTSKIIAYIVIGAIILGIFAYPFVLKKTKGNKTSGNIKAEAKMGIVSRPEEGGDGEEKEDGGEKGKEEEEEEIDQDELETRYDAILALLNDLKDDLDTGVISDDEYESMSGKYKTEAIKLMKKIDERNG